MSSISSIDENLNFSSFLFDVCIDFMSYSSSEFKERVDFFLSKFRKYIFISSSRVYSDNDSYITENTKRLLDISKDDDFIKTDEYSLAKAREENLLVNSKFKNWIIVRPYITYGQERFQLGVLEKENFLYRALHGRKIVFSKDILNHITTMTSGDDVAKGICAIVNHCLSLESKVFHITSPYYCKWQEILSIYSETLKQFGYSGEFMLDGFAFNLKRKVSKYQVIYDRYYDRKFDNSTINEIVETSKFASPLDPKFGIKRYLQEFILNPNFKQIDWALEAWNDKFTGEFTPLKEIPGISSKVNYLLRRYNLDLLANIIGYGVKIIKKLGAI